MQNKKSNKKPIRVAKIIGNIVFYTLIFLAIIAGIIGIIGKYKGKGNGIGLFGTNFFVVITPSMAHVNEEYKEFLSGHNDRILVGDLIITRRLKNGEKPKLYDVVTFYKDGQTIVHRIVDIQTGADGQIWYTTRGDSNNVTDGARTADEFTGILVKNAGQTWGDIITFMQSYYGIAAVAGIIAVVLVAILINDSSSKKPLTKEEKESKKMKELFGESEYNGAEEDDDDDEEIDGSEFD